MPMPTRAILPLIVLFGSTLPLAAQESGQGAGEAVVAVGGLAPGDELNIRATASPTGMVIGRVPNGTLLKNLGCSEANGARWCKVEDMHSARIAGWAAARYLLGSEAEAPDAAEIATGVEEAVSEPLFDASGDVPCASEFGQPMTICSAGVTRGEDGNAEVAVTLPDGDVRIIRFRGGKPDGSDSKEKLRATREADLHMIRIGKGERFEIPDALPFGG